MSSRSHSPHPRLLFCSYHGYLDPSSGAALSTRDLFELLSGRGWPCAVLSGPLLDFEQGASFENLLERANPAYQYRPGEIAGVACTLYHFVTGDIPVHVFVPSVERPHQPSRAPAEDEGRAFLQLFERVRKRFQPDVLITYGGHWLAGPLMERARQTGIKVVFSLRNLSYTGADLFREVDVVLVPSEFAQQHYREKLGIATVVLPGPWNWERFRCDKVEGRYVTFVNPQPSKGAFWFARIAYEMARHRPDISFLLVEGRGQANWLARCRLDLSGLTNLHKMPNTPDPREFYRVSKMVLMPSLQPETFGRVAVEAHSNGIPVLAARRGGLPEAMNGTGFLFDIPDHHTQKTPEAPSPEEVAPWLETIKHLWDDESFFAEQSKRCRQAAEKWKPERLLPQFERFFNDLVEANG